MSESLFNLLDDNNNGLIDSIELFTLLALFSDSRVEDRVRFLFDLYDFNERGYLEDLDIQFMFFTILMGLTKIYKLSTESPDNENSVGH